MPRKNNRDKRFDPKDYSNPGSYFDYPSPKSKPVRRRKTKNDKKIYRDNE